MSGNEQFERDFESFLAEDDSRLAALYRKLPRPEPDAKLDAAVLAMARRAATATPRARAPRWIPALSAAAVVALAAGIAFRIGPTVWQERDSGALQKTINENAAPPAAAPAPVEATRSADGDAVKDKSAELPVPKPAAAPEPQPQPRTTATPASAAGYAAPTNQRAHEPLRKTENAAKRFDTPAPQAFPQIEAREREEKSGTPGAAAAATDAVNAQAAGALVPEDALDRKRDERAAAPVAAPALKVREERAPTPMLVPPPPVQVSAPATPPPAMETQAVGGAPAESILAAPAPAAKAVKMMPARSNDPNATLYPEHWLANIRTMLSENKRDEALRSLAEFRKMYPDYHLPDDLRDLK